MAGTTRIRRPSQGRHVSEGLPRDDTYQKAFPGTGKQPARNGEGSISVKSSDGTNRNSVTTFYNLARLIHLKVDPFAAILWSEALREKTQLQLDDKEGLCGLTDPYDALASLFNDPSNRYQSDCITPGAFDNNGMYVPAQPVMGLLSKKCGMINPISERPARDGSWVRMKWKEVKSTLAVYFQRFTKSSNQDGEIIYNELVNFLDNGGAGVPSIAYYAICVLAWHDLICLVRRYQRRFRWMQVLFISLVRIR